MTKSTIVITAMMANAILRLCGTSHTALANKRITSADLVASPCVEVKAGPNVSPAVRPAFLCPRSARRRMALG